MIKGVNGTGKYITVTGGQASPPYISPGAQSAGNLRWNINTNVMEVYDGVSWKELAGGYANVELSYEADSLLDWARKERDKQRLREKRLQENPALRKAWEAIVRAQENFDMLETIAGEYSESTSKI